MLMLFVEASKTVWQSRSYGEGYRSLHEGGTELVEMPFGAQLASCTLAESIRFFLVLHPIACWFSMPGFTVREPLIQGVDK